MFYILYYEENSRFQVIVGLVISLFVLAALFTACCIFCGCCRRFNVNKLKNVSKKSTNAALTPKIHGYDLGDYEMRTHSQ